MSRSCQRAWLLMVWLLGGVSFGAAQEHVILLHGLARTERSMAPMQAALTQAGYAVANVGYPSRTASIEVLSEQVIGAALADARRQGATTIHFVTHSLGGILVRSYLARHTLPELGRVVMLGPPNQGSELVDVLGDWALFGWINGPAGSELGTKPDSIPLRLGGVNYSVGVVAGSRSVNWVNSVLIPGPDDGKVSVERTKLAGMADHIVIPATHPFIMRDREAIQQTIRFLREGHFDREPRQ